MGGIGDEIFFKIFFDIEGSPPLEKKFFVSDFDETQDFKSLWPRDFTHEIWAESETKIFLPQARLWWARFPPKCRLAHFSSEYDKIWIFFDRKSLPKSISDVRQNFLANWKNPGFGPFFALFLPIRIEKWSEPPFLIMILYFPSLWHRFLKKKFDFYIKRQFGRFWPNWAKFGL